MTQDERLFVDRYLAGSLTGLELKEFIDKLESNEDFKKDVSFHNLLIEGIYEAENKRVTSAIEKHIGYEKPFVPIALKLIVTFLVFTAGGIVLWNYIGPDKEAKRQNYFSLDFFRKHSIDTIVPVVEADNNQKIRKMESKKTIAQTDTIINQSEAINVDTGIISPTEASEIVVKKDQLLISFILKPIDINEATTNNESSSSIANSTVDKLNPSGGLPEIDRRKIENYYIEFWVSPVNYIGYKLSKDKLILFGIEEPDAVQLYTKEDKLWMKYGKEYYTLVESDDFESLINSEEIPSALK